MSLPGMSSLTAGVISTQQERPEYVARQVDTALESGLEWREDELC